MLGNTASRAGIFAAVLAALAAITLLPASASAQAGEKAKVTAAAAYTRSGPAEYWYVTGQLKRGDTVTVVGQQRGWAEIIPPAGHFSLVLKSQVDAQGNVIGNSPVPVRAGEQGGRRLNKIQTYLTPGASAKVTIHRDLGAYYQIAPPPGATVFVKLNLLDRGGETVEPTNNTGNNNINNTATSDNTTPTTAPEVAVRTVRPPTVSTTQPTGAMSMDDVRTRVLADQQAIREQLAKPLLDRDYASLLKRFETTKSDRAIQSIQGMGQYADAMIVWVQQQMRLQDAARSMATTRPDIDQAIADARKQMGTPAGPPLYEATGILRRSSALGNSVAMPRLHKLETVDGRKIICYVVPAASDDWTAIEGKEVQLAGRREYRPEWNFYLVRPEKVTVVGEGITITSKQPTATQPTNPDVPPDIVPLLQDPNLFVPAPAPTDTPAPAPVDGPGPETVAPPADRPAPPTPALRPLEPATQPAE